MERRSRQRSKSAPRKEPPPLPSKSPRGRPRKTVTKREPSRSRSRPRPSAKEQVRRGRSRSTSRTRRANNRETPPVVAPIVNAGGDNPSIDQMIRRSMSIERNNLIRRSARQAVAAAADSASASAKVDDQDGRLYQPPQETRLPTKKVEFGGWLGVLGQITAMLLLLGIVLLGCTKEQCELKPFHIPRNWRLYLNAESAAAVVGFYILQSVLSLLPLGRVVSTPNSLHSYRANGVLVATLTMLGVAGAWHQGYPVTQVYERWVSVAVAAYLCAWLLSLVLFIKGSYASVLGHNPYGNSGNHIYDFFAGRELNPYFFGRVNVKAVLLRSCVIATLLLDCLLALKGYEVRRELSHTLTLAVALRTIYCLDVLWFEESFSTTFEAQYDGLGFMNVQGLLVYPFLTGIVTRFILTHRVELPTYALLFILIVWGAGYFIYRASNLQKSTFRKNPHDPAISHLETIATNRGKKLLASGWWGIVKHPNYLGDIILHWAMAAPAGTTHALPYLIPLVLTLNFLHRAKRDDRRCAERYGQAWQEYTRRVPKYIIPKIY